MNKKLILSTVTIGLLGSLNVNAAEDLNGMFAQGKASGQLRLNRYNFQGEFNGK
ncbi:MAG: hypothetical protein PHO62_07320 [Sulfurimonas sp.]|uniref:hypothetical protein n=1 Tax=Sulfurimonas sp. TaxID=2022749 RepID=UPI00262EE095|nr:hypothetical protein [Sulfurimonas sp.]MDD5373222.1 hypothetical protein [Sulfurimonas sp.]